ncbi:hypothetical protein M413DRAFT_10158 [Hebeloma cylindrosporum]|uniref:Pentacotripeptide-repeat region of PRORP domain-containing protein n=1 Tax=Hebeloma cylindrosporum TaxID=76867 RepID=A0A0C3C1A5_HEBCY|nr:hypothetical protein M413DRAFT_10158 [Hebeloma cylindrosporum h7]
MRGALRFSRCISSRLRRIPSKPRSKPTRLPSADLATLLPSIEQFISTTPDAQQVIGFVNSKLNQIIPTTPSPHAIYEQVIKFLVRKRCPLEATTIYKRLRDDKFVASNSVDAQMLAVAVAYPRDDPQDMVDRLLEIVGQPGFTEMDLFSLVQTMNSYHVDRDLFAIVVQKFRDSMGPGYNPLPEVLAPLVAAAVQLGNLEDAFGLLERTTKKPRSAAARNFIYVAYVSLLATLRETRTWDIDSFERVLHLMTDRELSLQITVFNVLLSTEVRRGNPENALAMYSALKGMDFMRPDAQTFASLFTLYRRIRPRIMRKHSSAHLIPLRQLYSEFILATQQRVYPVRATTSLLNTAIRAFLRQRDYAGVFVVLNTFSLYRLPMNQKTYYAILRHLVRRIWTEVTSKRLISLQEVKWCDRYLGVHFNDIQLSEDLVDHILFLVSRKEFSLEAPFHPAEGELMKYDDKGKYKLPTMEMMRSIDTPDPQDFKYRGVPLQRLIRRAIFANMTGERGNVQRVSRAVVNAKQEMIPDYHRWSFYVDGSVYSQTGLNP